MPHTISTAGHVDHGKSTLIKALTGTDPDRFTEEKERGLTIDLGFALLQLPSGREVSFVDVPGHVRFLKNMLAGVGAVDACLFVVAATEGWKPQTEEHLRVLELLGLRHGIVVLTKVAIADNDLLELARLDVADHIQHTFLESAEVVETDALTGQGIPELYQALDRLLDRTPQAKDQGRPRLWVDRSFTIKGSGTVVTGTLAGGSLSPRDQMVLSPQETEVRIRSIESHDQQREVALPGSRVALNLSGISHQEVGRGDVLVRKSQWHLTSQLDASLHVLESLGHEVSRRGAYVAYFGSGEFPVRLRILGSQRAGAKSAGPQSAGSQNFENPSNEEREPHDLKFGDFKLQPGASAAVRLYLPCQLPLLPGDRYVLREFGRSETVGGGEVLDVSPVLPASKAKPDKSVDRVISERGWVRAEELARLVGDSTDQIDDWRVGEWVVWPEALDQTRQVIAEKVANADVGGCDLAALSDQERAALEGMDEIVVSGGLVRATDTEDTIAQHPYLQQLRGDLFSPPAPDKVGRSDLRALLNSGLVVEAEGIYFAFESVKTATRAVSEMLNSNPTGFTVAEIREKLNTTRKYVLPLLGILDASGITRRQGDVRIAGPKLTD